MNRYPLRVEARRDESLSRWLWLSKWLLLIPHYLVLAVLGVGFVILTLVAYLAVLFTGRYPHAIFSYNVGVLRWSWRVGYYGYEALGTDRYPPFTLADVPDYPARLSVAEPPQPPRWLPLMAWLFAIPHMALLAGLTGAARWEFRNGDTLTSVPLSLVAVGILIAGFALLFTGRYPRGLYDLLVGVARWTLRVIAYLALLTPRYPPFRLDQGEHEPDRDPTGPDTAHQVTARPNGVAGPVTALVAGVVLLLPAAGLAAAGGALLAFDGARDRDGYVTSSLVHMQSSTAAITAESITLQDADLWTRNLTRVGGVRITATATGGTPLFVGIARQDAVDAWLSASAHDEIVGVPAGAARYERSAGTLQAVTAPTMQRFWLASATSSGTATLDWQATTGTFTVVLANAEGTPGIAANVRAAVQTPDLTPLGAGLLTTGIVLSLLAIGLIIVGGVGLGRHYGGPRPPVGPPPAHTGPVPETVTPPAPATSST